MKLFRIIAVTILASTGLLASQQSSAGQADAKRFILAYRANQAPIRMLHYLGRQEVSQGNSAKGKFLECLSVNLSPDELAAALVPFVEEQFPDAETINRVSEFLEGQHGRRMLDQLEAQLGNITTIVENKVRTNVEDLHLSLSKADLEAIRAFERTPDYAAFNKFVESIPSAFSHPEMKAMFEAAKLKCMPR